MGVHGDRPVGMQDRALERRELAEKELHINPLQYLFSIRANTSNETHAVEKLYI